MAADAGHVVADGVRFQVRSVILHGGNIEIHARAHGPVRASSAEPVATVFGDDGEGVLQMAVNSTWPSVNRHGWVDLILPVRIEAVVDSPRSQ